MVPESVNIQFEPPVPFTVQWSMYPLAGAGANRATLVHAPFRLGGRYVLSVTAGQSVLGAPVQATSWPFRVIGNSVYLPLIKH